MSKARLIITAVVLEGRSQADVARTYGVSKGWVSKLVARWRLEGDAAFQTRSRRPRSSPNATPPAVIERILNLRVNLQHQGLDHGPSTIAWHLAHHHSTRVSRATIARIASRWASTSSRSGVARTSVISPAYETTSAPTRANASDVSRVLGGRSGDSLVRLRVVA